jgi:hypothetical protein
MDIQGKNVMILGGSGEVGFSICRRILEEKPKRLVVAALKREEVEEAIEELKREFPETTTEILGAFGNIFVRTALKDKGRNEILRDPVYRRWIMEDVLGEFTEEILKDSYLNNLIEEFKPDILIDSINTATALAYQDVYWSAQEVKGLLEEKRDMEDAVARLLTSLYIPQLVRHIQILNESMRRNGVSLYIKVGTTGTGGMGLNIPYTHGEERPSRVLLSKAAVAGAQTLLLFLMARTPEGPIVKEVKPAALIAWRGIGVGPIRDRTGRPISLLDCPIEEGYSLERGREFKFSEIKCGRAVGGTLESVYIDTGENGVFSLDEFKAITTLGQMEYITPEEIAETVIMEIKGGNTSKDIIDALDGAVMGATYRAGFLREFAIERMRRLIERTGKYGVAFEILGPPRLSKLLFEAEILRRVYGTMEKVVMERAEEISEKAEDLIRKDRELRTQAISIGIPILLKDGRTLLFSSNRKPEKGWEVENWVINDSSIEHWARTEWIDLRENNMSLWKSRFEKILEEEKRVENVTGSIFDRSEDFWARDPSTGEHLIDPGEVVGWIFIYEEKGYKMKA